eukprot:gene18924-21527_t
MADLEEIKQDIADTKAELTDAKMKLAEAMVDKNQSEIDEWKARRNTLEALLIEQQREKNLLLSSQATAAQPAPVPNEWVPNTSSLRILGDDVSGPHSTAIIVGRKTVLACAHSLDLIKDDSKRHTKKTTHYQYLEDYWVQSRFTKNKRGECTAEDRVRIKLFKFHETNDWALFTRTDSSTFLESDVSVIDTSLLTNPNTHLTHKNARVLHCPVSLVSSILKVNEFPVGCQISAVHIQAQSSHHVKYEGRDLCKGSSGGAVFVYPSSSLLGMHSEAINEAEYEGEEEVAKSIADTDKRVHSEDDAYQLFESAPEPKQKKVKSDSETIASIAGGINGLGSALIVCKFSRLMHYIRELEDS